MKYCIMIMLLFELQACRTYNIDGSEIKVINDIFDNLIEEMGMIVTMLWHMIQWCVIKWLM